MTRNMKLATNMIEDKYKKTVDDRRIKGKLEHPKEKVHKKRDNLKEVLKKA